LVPLTDATASLSGLRLDQDSQGPFAVVPPVVQQPVMRPWPTTLWQRSGQREFWCELLLWDVHCADGDDGSGLFADALLGRGGWAAVLRSPV